MAKMTKKEYFTELTKLVNTVPDENKKTELLAFIAREVELLDKKAASKKLTKTQEENLSIMESILVVLTELDKPVTIAEIKAASDELSEFTPQKMSALLKKLVDDNKVVKTIDKKKTYFAIAK